MTDSLTVRHTADPKADTSLPDPHQDTFSKTYFGFWIYLMTDCVLFATLFITYAVLHDKTYGGPSAHDLFDLSLPLKETVVLLLSSVTCGFAVLSAAKNKITRIIPWLIVTFILGSTFLFLELSEFAAFLEEGHSWTKSAFLSSFFTLVGAHGLHITVGLLWIGVMIAQLIYYGLTVTTFRRLAVFSLFWHFLDLIWVFLFTFVYLMGVI
ncbi:MAG: cytochrome o ubiquinol oxidase subunit III [Chlamydiota bacterium]|nr:cytochrome o ubiquinol oxidase subunit III [Chlamydiota bacterium]